MKEWKKFSKEEKVRIVQEFAVRWGAPLRSYPGLQQYCDRTNGRSHLQRHPRSARVRIPPPLRCAQAHAPAPSTRRTLHRPLYGQARERVHPSRWGAVGAVGCCVARRRHRQCAAERRSGVGPLWPQPLAPPCMLSAELGRQHRARGRSQRRSRAAQHRARDHPHRPRSRPLVGEDQHHAKMQR